MPILPSKIETFAIAIENLKLKLYKEAVIKDFCSSPILLGFFTLFQILDCSRKNPDERGGDVGFGHGISKGTEERACRNSRVQLKKK